MQNLFFFPLQPIGLFTSCKKRKKKEKRNLCQKQKWYSLVDKEPQTTSTATLMINPVPANAEIWPNWIMTVIRSTQSFLLDARQPFLSPLPLPAEWPPGVRQWPNPPPKTLCPTSSAPRWIDGRGGRVHLWRTNGSTERRWEAASGLCLPICYLFIY